MYIVKFRTTIFFTDVISTSSPIPCGDIGAFILKVQKAGFEVLNVYPADNENNEDYEGEEIIIEDIDLDDEE